MNTIIIGTETITVSNTIPPQVQPAMIMEGFLVNGTSEDELLCPGCAMPLVVTVDLFLMACVGGTRLLIMTNSQVKMTCLVGNI